MRHHFIVPVLAAALLAAPATAEEMALSEQAPDRYVVVPGDTLWSIAGRFLKQPWRWPEIWRLNQEQIKNPNRIYPGDVIVLDRGGPSPSLALRPTVKLGPQTRYERHPREAIPTIPTRDIEPFLSKPLVISPGQLDASPYIISTAGERVAVANGDTIHVRGLPNKDGDDWHIYRQGKALVDPDSEELLGHEAIYLGDARVLRHGDPSTLTVLRASQEIYKGDRLVAAQHPGFEDYVPHAPDKPLKGKVIAVYGGVAEGGRNSVITLNRGAGDGLERGHVLALYRGGQELADYEGKPEKAYYNPLAQGCLQPGKEVSFDKPYDRKEAYGPCPDEAPPYLLPEERVGLVMVFRTFERVSYALVMNSTGPVKVLDLIRKP